MARRGGMNLGPMTLVVMIVVGIVVAVAMYSFIPVVGYNIDSTSPIVNDCVDSSTAAAPAAWNCSVWNSSWKPTGVTVFTNASQLWMQVSGLPILLILAVVIGAAIGYFMLIGGRR